MKTNDIEDQLQLFGDLLQIDESALESPACADVVDSGDSCIGLSTESQGELF